MVVWECLKADSDIFRTASRMSLGFARMFEGCFGSVSGMCRWYFWDFRYVWCRPQACLKDVSAVFQGCFRDVSDMFQRCFRNVLEMIQGCLKDVLTMFLVWNFNVSDLFQGFSSHVFKALSEMSVRRRIKWQWKFGSLSGTVSTFCAFMGTVLG